jgi:SAM-dependent methyltransferase
MKQKLYAGNIKYEAKQGTHHVLEWGNYSKDYDRSLKHNNHAILVNNFTKENDKLTFNQNLHFCSEEIYQLVNHLKVKSVFDCGCGAGYHLLNIKKIFPEINVSGADYLQSQIEVGEKYYGLKHHEIRKNLKVKDLTLEEGIEELGKHELVYTSAVLMHLSRDLAYKLLKNMGVLSTKYIHIFENKSAHDFTKLLGEALPDFEVVNYDIPNFPSIYRNKSFILLKRK